MPKGFSPAPEDTGDFIQFPLVAISRDDARGMILWMRRVVRYIFMSIFALSLLLSVAVCVLWVRSYYVIEGVICAWADDRSVGWATGPGGLYAGYYFGPAELNTPKFEYVSIPVSYPLAPPATPVFEVAGFGAYADSERRTARVPMVVPLLGCMICALWSFRRLRPRPPFACATCGYDLRASPGRCPECGAVKEE